MFTPEYMVFTCLHAVALCGLAALCWRESARADRWEGYARKLVQRSVSDRDALRKTVVAPQWHAPRARPRPVISSRDP